MPLWNALLAWLASNGAVELPIALPIVGSSVAAIIRQDGFKAQTNGFIAWAAVLFSAGVVGLSENALIGDPTHVAATILGIVALLIGGALHSLSPYLTWLSWVQSHVLDVYGTTVSVDVQKKFASGAASAVDEAVQNWLNDRIPVVKNPQEVPVVHKPDPRPIMLPTGLTANSTTNSFFPPTTSVQLAPAQQPVVAQRQVQLPPTFVNPTDLQVTKPVAAINQPRQS